LESSVTGAEAPAYIKASLRDALFKAPNAAEKVQLHPPAANMHQPLIADFVEAVLTGREPQVNGETGRIASIEAEIYAPSPMSLLDPARK